MFPYLQEVSNPSKKYTVNFRGINYGEGTQDGEFADTLNLSTDQYPCITQRAARIKDGEYASPSTLHSKGELLVIDGKDVLYGGNKVGEVEPGKKQTATVGNYIVIFPDKKYYKVPTEDDQDGEFGCMDVEWDAAQLTFKADTISASYELKEQWYEFTSSTISVGTVYKSNKIAPFDDMIGSWTTRPPFKEGDVIKIEGTYEGKNDTESIEIKKISTKSMTNGINYRLKFASYFPDQRSVANTSGSEITLTKLNPFTLPFKAGETVEISGCTIARNNKEAVIKEATESTLTFEEGTFTPGSEYGEITIKRTKAPFPFRKGDAVLITGCSTSENNRDEGSEVLISAINDDELVFEGVTFAEATETGDVTIKRSIPDLDLICENNYRLWGTHENTIYSSKFSDPLNFKVFEGLESDSYAIEVASEGEFTGCMAYSTHICFFKENTLHKMYGTKPSNFQINTSNVYGVQSGSEKSMQIVNEQLLYKGVGGVYAYTGGIPELISEKFGTNRYSNAVGCCDGEKYYLSMKQGNEWHFFSYDVLKNIWLREDDTQAVDMTFYDGKVYYLDAKGELYHIDKEADRSDIEWGATFCTFHETINERKGYSKFHLRMDLEAGAWLAVDIKTDNDLKWKQIYTTHSEKAKTATIPIIPTRCDSIDIRLRGKGKCTVKAFVREFSVGSDV